MVRGRGHGEEPRNHGRCPKLTYPCPEIRRRTAFVEESGRQPLRLPFCGSTIDQFEYLHWRFHSLFSISLTVYRCQDRRAKHLPDFVAWIGDQRETCTASLASHKWR